MPGKKKQSEKTRKASNAGRSFQVRVVKSLKAYAERHGGWTYRTTDKITGAGFGRSYKVKTPHDVLFISDDLSLMIECKISYDSDRFNFGAVDKGEEDALLQFTASGGRLLGVVFFCDWRPGKPGDLIIMSADKLRNERNKRHFKWTDELSEIDGILVKRTGSIYKFTPKIMRRLLKMRRAM